MNYYVTLFDKKYLPHGLALYNSMCKFCLPFKLIILCVDDLTFNTLKVLDLKHIQLLKLSDLENQNLKKIKKLYSKMKDISGENPNSFRSIEEIISILDKKKLIKKEFITKPIYILKS